MGLEAMEMDLGRSKALAQKAINTAHRKIADIKFIPKPSPEKTPQPSDPSFSDMYALASFLNQKVGEKDELLSDHGWPEAFAELKVRLDFELSQLKIKGEDIEPFWLKPRMFGGIW